MKPYTYFGAETYNCDAYGQHAFGECGTAGASTDNGGLSYTGDVILVPLALAGAILIASVILVIKQIRRRKAAAKDPS